MKYRGIVIDQLGTLNARHTRWYGTWMDAQVAAERLCKRTMSSRGTLDIERRM